MAIVIPDKRRAALASIGSGVLLTVIKLVVAFTTGSLAILSEAAHSALDLLAAAITFGVVWLADQPPDENHPYGHARAESLGALAETMLLGLTAIWVFWQAYERIFVRVETPAISIWAFVVVVISLVIDFTRSRALARAAREHKSQALAADAAHFANDMLSSLVVLIGLGAFELSLHTQLVPPWLAPRIDAIAASMVALIALFVSWQLGRKAVLALMDDVPLELNRRLAASVETLPGIVAHSSRVRARFVGEQPYVDVALKVPRGRSLEEAALVSDAARELIQQELPGADVVVNVIPARTESEEYSTAVYAAAHRLGMSVHNLDIFQLGNGLCIVLDLELPGELSLHEGHRESEALANAIRQELPDSTEISIHLEPRRDRPQPAVRYQPIQEEVTGALQTLPGAEALRSVNAFLVDGGPVVTVRCAYPPETPLAEVHDSMARLERTLRRLVPNIVRLQIDPEPAGEPIVQGQYQHGKGERHAKN
jgi:cation diffusion facilitator family transporter